MVRFEVRGSRFAVGYEERGIPQGLKPSFGGGAGRAKPEGLAYLEATTRAKANTGILRCAQNDNAERRKGIPFGNDKQKERKQIPFGNDKQKERKRIPFGNDKRDNTRDDLA
jgi:hypothetical protein